MHMQAKGFSAVEALVVLVIVGLIGAGGYVVYHRGHTSTGSVSTVVHSSAPAGTTQNIDDLITQDQDNENAIDSSHETSEQSDAQSANSAAAGIGGAYNESSF